MAVLPSDQKKGVGSVLVRAGLDRCRDMCSDFAVVVVRPQYDPRLGLVPASQFGLECPWKLPDGVFMAMELRPGALASRGGPITYEPEFDAV
jgi:putative acetyltransferase